MTEEEWLKSTKTGPMLEFLYGKLSDRKLRLFVVACCRRVWDGLRDVRSRTAVEVAEKFADGASTEDELLASFRAAYAAVDDCLKDSAFSEDQAIAAYLSAAAQVNEVSESGDLSDEDVALYAISYAIDGSLVASEIEHAKLLRDIFGNPFRPVVADPAWLTPTAVSIASAIYQDRAFDRLPILADALEEAGCTNADVLLHCRQPGEHVRGCWVVDLVLGKA